MIGSRDHEMGVQRDSGCGGGGFHEGGAEGDVVDEVAVHDVEVEPVGAGGFSSLNFSLETAEVAGEDRGSDDERMHGRNLWELSGNWVGFGGALEYRREETSGKAERFDGDFDGERGRSGGNWEKQGGSRSLEKELPEGRGVPYERGLSLKG